LFDEEHIEYLRKFEEHCKANRIANSDVGSYKTIDDIISAVSIADQIQKQKEAEKQIIKLYESPDYLLLIPLTFEASKIYGANTKWCVTQKTHWDSYQWGWRLIYVMDRKNNKKYAISRNYSTNEIQGWLENDKQVSPMMLPIDATLFPILTEHLQKDLYVPELTAAGDHSIITDTGFMVSLDKASKDQIKQFINRFGSVLDMGSTLNRNITERLKQLGLSSMEIKNLYSSGSVNLGAAKNKLLEELLSGISKSTKSDYDYDEYKSKSNKFEWTKKYGL
jgi:hypothetical protein